MLVLADEYASSSRAAGWFVRNGYLNPSMNPLPVDHPLRPLVIARRAVIERNRWLRLIERPEFKRRWTLPDWDGAVRDAATCMLLDAIESEARRDPTICAVRDLTAILLRDTRLREIAALRFPGEDDIAARTAELIAADSVPYLVPLRFTSDGLVKRALWERTWDLQRLEDAGETLSAPIPVPPKYDREDYRDPRYWSLRGRLDVPRERFISYPFATTDDDPSPLYGWSGWDHKQRADALAALYQRRKTEDGWPADRLVPLLAGLLELVSWLKQWHNEPAPGEDQGAGDAYAAFIENEARELGHTLDALRAWRPPEKHEERKANRARSAIAVPEQRKASASDVMPGPKSSTKDPAPTSRRRRRKVAEPAR